MEYSLPTERGPAARDAEEIFSCFAGRPHWGKASYLDAEAFADLYGNSWMK
jgi:hypothetical protein